MNKILATVLLTCAISQAANYDFQKGIDMTGKTNVTASQLNQLVDNATVTTNRGLVITTATNPPAGFSNYLWKDISVDPPVLRIYSATYGWTNLVLPTNTVTTTSIENNSITGAKLALNTISNVNIRANAIATTNIVDLAVTANKIAADAIVNEKITDSTITGAKLAAGTVTYDKIAAGTITSNQLANATIANVNIADGAIVVGKLGQSAIVRTNLAADSVDSTNIIAGTIGNSDIAENAIAGNQIQTGAIRSTNIISGGVDITNINSSFSAYLPIAYGMMAPNTVVLSQNIASMSGSAGNYTITLTNMTTTNLVVVGSAAGTVGPLTLEYVSANLGAKTFTITTRTIGAPGAATAATLIQLMVYGY